MRSQNFSVKAAPSDRPRIRFRTLRAALRGSATAILLLAAPMTVLAQGGGPNEPPQAAFVYDCASLDCAFDATGSTDPDGPSHKMTYRWAFGDGGTATGSTPNHAYGGAGTYRVELTVKDQKGATGTEVEDVMVETPPPENAPPTASFAFSCTDLDCSFDGSASSDAEDGSPVAYDWAFGDGSLSSGAIVSHSYGNGATYTVTLTVADSGGLLDEDAQPVTATEPPPPPNSPPNASFTFSCSGLACSFDGSSSTDPEDGEPASYAWDFGDGGTGSGASTSHAYSAGGTYTVQLVVTDARGLQDAQSGDVTVVEPPPPPNTPPTAAFTFSCVHLECSFDGSSSDDPEDGAAGLAYAWDFGEGSIGTGMTTNHSYAQDCLCNVVLVVTDNGGANDSVVHFVEVYENTPPYAYFEASCSGWLCAFDARETWDWGDGPEALSFTWEFGDGSEGQGATTSHEYSIQDKYMVRLNVTDPGGLSDEYAGAVFVHDPSPGNHPPIASLGASCDRRKCDYWSDSQDAQDPPGFLSYAWDFGDGTTHTGCCSFGTHTYAAPGEYTITLVVTDTSSLSDSDAQDVVTTSPPEPVARFAVSCTQRICYFDASGSEDEQDADEALTFSWDFGDGNASSEIAPRHTYGANGGYSVKLRVTDTDGFQATGTRSLVISSSRGLVQGSGQATADGELGTCHGTPQGVVFGGGAGARVELWSGAAEFSFTVRGCDPPTIHNLLVVPFEPGSCYGEYSYADIVCESEAGARLLWNSTGELWTNFLSYRGVLSRQVLVGNTDPNENYGGVIEQLRTKWQYDVCWSPVWGVLPGPTWIILGPIGYPIVCRGGMQVITSCDDLDQLDTCLDRGLLWTPNFLANYAANAVCKNAPAASDACADYYSDDCRGSGFSTKTDPVRCASRLKP